MSAPVLPGKRHRVRIRHVRRLLWGLLARLLPEWTRALGFYLRAIPYAEVGTRAWVHETRIPNPLTGGDRDFVASRCARYETSSVPRYWECDLVHRREAWVIRGAVGLARTSSLSIPSLGVLATADGGTTNHVQVRAHRPGRTIPLDGLSFMVPNASNYFHFHDDVLLPLAEMAEAGTIWPRRIVLPPRITGFARDVLRRVAPALGLELFEPGPRDRLSGDWVALSKRRGCTEWTDLDRAAAARLSALLRRAYGVAPASTPQRLYLDRGKGARSIRPGAGLDAFLANMRLDRFVAHSGNVGEQIARFAAAEVVFAVHGAGLTNMLHMPPRGCVIEVLPCDLVKSTYRMMARQVGHDYVGEVAVAGGFRNPVTPDWPALRAALALSP